MRIGIIGAGISGLAAAVQLIPQGHEVKVFERAEELGEVGAGIMLPPNAARVYEAWGFEDSLRRVSSIPKSLKLYEAGTGKIRGEYQMVERRSCHASPMYLVYRPDLIEMLSSGVPESSLFLGKALIGLEQRAESVNAIFNDGASQEFDLLIGADGIRSATRQAIHGGEAARFSGSVAYRALVAGDRARELGIDNSSHKWWGTATEHNIVYYYLRGGEILNVAAFVPDTYWGEESWTAQGDARDLRDAFSDFAEPVPTLLGGIGEAPLRWAIFDRKPLTDSWVKGRVVLVGDAAHPMVPFLGQGAAMAVEDVATLTEILKRVGTELGIHRGLALYQELRLQRAARVQEGSRTVSIDTWKQRDWMYGFDALSEVKRRLTNFV